MTHRVGGLMGKLKFPFPPWIRFPIIEGHGSLVAGVSWVRSVLPLKTRSVATTVSAIRGSRRAASPLVRLVKGEEMREAFDYPRVFSLKSGVEPSKIVLSPAWCSKLWLTGAKI
ncbi:hypothetical protein TNCV_4496011 [Trichonephila clavipes]|nr:hypothetical protein TNCV_4496011 [Trichonephila clavipes]